VGTCLGPHGGVKGYTEELKVVHRWQQPFNLRHSVIEYANVFIVSITVPLDSLLPNISDDFRGVTKTVLMPLSQTSSPGIGGRVPKIENITPSMYVCMYRLSRGPAYCGPIR